VLFLLILIPLVSAVLIRLGLFRRSRLSGYLGCMSVLLSFLCLCSYGKVLSGQGLIIEQLIRWNILPGQQISMDLVLDPLSFVMCLLVTGVGFLIHLYSLGYMKVDQYQRYYGYLNLFIALMLLLVLSDQMLLMFVGWEGVGLCSFLLIGFYGKEHQNMNAAKKAFIVNRIGDLGLVSGMLILLGWMFTHTGAFTLSFQDMMIHREIFLDAKLAGLPLSTWVGALLFLGICGKSAQIPLHIWLPDAMAGPTPVSALIHAASMVTAGIYLLCRMHFIFGADPMLSTLVMWVGLVTALMGSIVAIFQYDIKKILAFSTISQLGYMTLACGMGAFRAAIFHVLIHGVFKALLFLCAGNMIKANFGVQDIRECRGLRQRIPSTHRMMWVGGLSLTGIFPLAGFFSKDLILFEAFLHHRLLFPVLLVSVFCTGFYMFRLIFFSFTKLPQDHDQKAFTFPLVMRMPLWGLSFLTLTAGWLWPPAFLGFFQSFPAFLNETLGYGFTHHDTKQELFVLLISMGVSIASIICAKIYCQKGFEFESYLQKRFPKLANVLSKHYILDELYHRTFVPLHGPTQTFSEKPITTSMFHFIAVFKGLFDRYVLDGLVHWFAWLPQGLGALFGKIQNGHIQSYLRWMTMITMILLFYWFLWTFEGAI